MWFDGVALLFLVIAVGAFMLAFAVVPQYLLIAAIGFTVVLDLVALQTRQERTYSLASSACCRRAATVLPNTFGLRHVL